MTHGRAAAPAPAARPTRATQLRLRLRRDDKVVGRTVATVAAPDDARRAIIGIRVAQDAKIELPLKVDIDLGDVGGPSAGLPFALEVLQELGHDVDRGHRVAATGEIELDGTVEPVGGVKQKTLRRAARPDADVFLVPAGENAADGTPVCREACASSLWRVFNRRCALCERCRRSSLFAGISPGLATPANCGDFRRRSPLRARGDVGPQWPLSRQGIRLVDQRRHEQASYASCNDCYFRRAGLCALPGNTPCPTFRAATRERPRARRRSRGSCCAPTARQAPSRRRVASAA